MGRGRESGVSQGLGPSCLFLQRGQSQENKAPQERLVTGSSGATGVPGSHRMSGWSLG